MATPIASWPTSNPAPNPNPTWSIIGVRDGRRLTVMGLAYLDAPADYFDFNSSLSVVGKPLFDVSPGGAVGNERYDYNQTFTDGSPQENGTWRWQTGFITVIRIPLYDDGPIACVVRFTGTREGDKVDMDTPVAQLV